jgi:hypothetical protein
MTSAHTNTRPPPTPPPSQTCRSRAQPPPAPYFTTAGLHGGPRAARASDLGPAGAVPAGEGRHRILPRAGRVLGRVLQDPRDLPGERGEKGRGSSAFFPLPVSCICVGERNGWGIKGEGATPACISVACACSCSGTWDARSWCRQVYARARARVCVHLGLELVGQAGADALGPLDRHVELVPRALRRAY